MYQIQKITSHHVVDFAAEELKKYLRMMMPRCGEIDIAYAPDATEGFRLGLMADFGLDTSEAADVELDDIVHIDCDEKGGIIAGSNPRSVLLAVYRYLTINGCRWLFPGIDGEFIPVKEIEPVSYHKMADCRYRGQCNEGAESQPVMMEAIDFTPKIGMNIFMIEFDNPKAYYDKYYNHLRNENVRGLEPITADTALQWKRQCETEMAKRGLQFHDMGHGWTADPFGLNTTGGWIVTDENTANEDAVQFMALLNGKRELFGGVALNTNFCMSNPKAREKVVKAVADYAESATNVDYLHVWLADGANNHCECEECTKMTPSDWYIVMMNEIDEELTSRGLATRIVFIEYVDTTWAPETVTIKNPDRFSLLIAAITRDYTECVDPKATEKEIPLRPFDLNKNVMPSSVNEYLAHAKKWREKCPGVPSFVYEYHYWVPQFRDLAVLDAARMVYDDVRGYKANGCNGIVEDASQRSFYPNGFSFYVYGSTLFDTSIDFEALKEDYFYHAYGEDWKEVVSFLEKLGQLVDFRYMNGKLSSDREKGLYYNPNLVPSFRQALELVEEFAPFVEAHKNSPKRAQTVAYRLLNRHMEYCRLLIPLLIKKAVGLGQEAQNDFYDFLDTFGVYEREMEACYDQYMCGHSLRMIFGKKGFSTTY